MSAPSDRDPRFDRAAIGDGGLLDAHGAGPQPDRSRSRSLFAACVGLGCALFAAVYTARYSGRFDAGVYDENAAASRGEAAAAKPDPVAAGRRLFNSAGACVTCHQPTGQGIPGVYPPLAGSEWVNGPGDRAARILLCGLKGPLTVRGTVFPGAAAMPSFGASGFNWSDAKIAFVLTYVRQEWGNKAPPVTADTVARIRREVGPRREWTQEELSGAGRSAP